MAYNFKIPQIPDELGKLAELSLGYVQPITYEGGKKKISSEGVDILQIISKTLSNIDMDALRLAEKDLEEAIIPNYDLKPGLKGIKQYTNRNEYFEKIVPNLDVAYRNISRALKTKGDSDFNSMMVSLETEECAEYIPNQLIIPRNEYLVHKHEILKKTSELNQIFEDNTLNRLHELDSRECRDILKDAGFHVMNPSFEALYKSKGAKKVAKASFIVGGLLSIVGAIRQNDSSVAGGLIVTIPGLFVASHLEKNYNIINIDTNLAGALRGLSSDFKNTQNL